MASTTVRVSAETHELLRKLAAATGEPLQQVRSLAVDRLGPQPFGRVPAAVLASVENRLRLLLAL